MNGAALFFYLPTMSALEDSFEVRGLFTEDAQYIQIQAWQAFRRTFSKWVGKELLVTVKVLRYKRSDSQNRYIHSVVVGHVRHWLFETQGVKYTHDEVYSWLRTNLLGYKPKITVIAGEEVITMTGKRFSAMNTKEFATAIDTIRQEMLERGLDIPEPSKDKRKHNLLEEFLEDT